MTVLTSGVCVKNGLPVGVLGVDALRPTGGLRVTDFTVWEPDKIAPYGEYPKQRLTETPAAAGSRTVTLDCNDSGKTAWFTVELETNAAANVVASVSGFALSYRTGLNDRRAVMRYGYVLCPGDDSSADICQPEAWRQET